MEEPNTSENLSVQVQEKLNELEKVRLDKIETNKFIWGGAFVLALIVVGVFLTNGGDNLFFLLFILLLLGVIAYAITSYRKNKISKRFKTEVMPLALSQSHPDLEYQPLNHIAFNDFKASQLFNQRIDRYKGEDLFIGQRDKTAYIFSEIHAEEKHTSTDSKGRTRTTYVTIFKGLFMKADFNKKIRTFTRVVEGGDGFFTKLFAGKDKVELEHPDFEKIFNTYSEDQVEARYILTPDLMEKILALKSKFNTKIALSFLGNNVYIAISTKENLFEPNLSEVFDAEQIGDVDKQIEMCLEIIDLLGLNTRIWTKR